MGDNAVQGSLSAYLRSKSRGAHVRGHSQAHEGPFSPLPNPSHGPGQRRWFLFGTNGEEPLDVVKLSQMEWLNGCIGETLRLLPTVPSGPQRSVLKVRVRKYSGSLLPEETQLFLHTYSIYSIHRDERNFHTPEAFLSERWFSKGTPAGEHSTTAFIPFSYGPTICAGKNLALMENASALAPAPAPSSTPPYHQHHQPLPPSHPLAPQLRPPSPAAAPAALAPVVPPTAPVRIAISKPPAPPTLMPTNSRLPPTPASRPRRHLVSACAW
ncbi:cytochrome P450 [Russula earlei]|uniref:Cytochrome P450 n=1 Tax=Russula earlei TaxID=71964 RepID=A0ACC0UBN4_9AGAM|nr:cytochrome P450 [Russula earlei]